jgi:hypothetical protein
MVILIAIQWHDFSLITYVSVYSRICKYIELEGHTSVVCSLNRLDLYIFIHHGIEC